MANDKSIIGVDADTAPKLIDRLTNIIDDACAPRIRPSVYMENVGGQILIVVEVFPGSQRPYYIKGEGLPEGVYVRVSATTRKADKSTIRELERERENIRFDEEICYRYERNLSNEGRFKDEFYQYTGRTLAEKDLIDLKIGQSFRVTIYAASS